MGWIEGEKRVGKLTDEFRNGVKGERRSGGARVRGEEGNGEEERRGGSWPGCCESSQVKGATP